jgi:hypothetical protein
MDWEEYRRRYVTFDLALQQTRIVAAAAASVLRDFPSNLPEELRGAMELARERFLKAVLSEAGDASGKGFVEARQSLDQAAHSAESYVELGSILGTAHVEAGLDNMDLDADPDDIDCELAASVQQLVMSLAHLDAFLADTLFAICETRPAVRHSDQPPDQQLGLETGDWDELAQRLPVTFVEEFMRAAAAKRITAMRKAFGLQLNLPPHVLNDLRFAQNVRNLYVHAGGRVSQEFMRRTKWLQPHIGAFDLSAFGVATECDDDACESDDESQPTVDPSGWTLGELMPLNLHVADELTRLIQNTAGGVFCAVSVQFFGRPCSELGNVHFW